MEAHLGFFEEFHNKVVSAKLIDVKESEEKIKVILNGDEGITTIHLGVEENRKGELKVGGIFSKDK